MIVNEKHMLGGCVVEDNILSVARDVLSIESAAISKASLKLGDGFSRAVELIEGTAPAGRVVVIGMGKSGHIGNKIAATFASTGTPAFTVHPGEAGHGDLGMLTEHDTVIAISQLGKVMSYSGCFPILSDIQ